MICDLEQVGPMAVCRVCGKAVMTYGSAEVVEALCGGAGAFVVPPRTEAEKAAPSKTIAPRRRKKGCGACGKSIAPTSQKL